MTTNETTLAELSVLYGIEKIDFWVKKGAKDKRNGLKNDDLLAAHTAHGIAYTIGWNGESETKFRFRVDVLDLMHLHLDPIYVEAENTKDAIRKVKARMKVYRLKVSEYSFKARLTNEDDKNTIGYLAEFGD
jgi:hypothetical protein